MRCDIEFIWNFDPKVLRVLSFFSHLRLNMGFQERLGIKKEYTKSKIIYTTPD